MTRRAWLAMCGVGPAAGIAAATQPRYIDGVFAHAGREPIELLAYADRTATGRLQLGSASFEDVPVVDHVYRVLCSLPTWKPVLVWTSTKVIFRDETARRRQLTFGSRQLSIYALELRIADVETPERAGQVIRGLRATEDDPAYLFITMSNGSVTRDYMVELRAG